MRILHLGFEDHRRPGSGGGALRNHEVNRRLVAKGHQVEVVTARYPRATRRVEDGVAYRHIGLGGEYYTSLLSYHAVLPAVVLAASRRRQPLDLLVEEFAPPWSTLGVGRWTRIPTVGNVQGYFAAEKAQEYHLPRAALIGAQRWGTRGHRHLIALSADLASRLGADAPHADISVVPMGVAHEEIRQAIDPSLEMVARQILFLGRFEIAQKGLDLLLRACATLLDEENAQLIIAGDGRDSRALRMLAEKSPGRDRISFCGRVSGRDKWRLLASSQLSVMPSRYETFGLSALEALACGTPVVGFDIDCLRETVPRGTGILVQPFDTDALREGIRTLLRAPRKCAAMAERGREHAGRYSWERVATAQENVYRAAAYQ